MHPMARKEGLVVQSVDEEILVYDLETNKAFCLNSTSKAIWNACDGEHTISEIARVVEDRLNEKVETKVVRFALDQLEKEGLVTGYSPEKGNQVTRRAAIQRLALSSAVALPVVASLIAPPAYMAQSGCVPAAMNPPGCPCTMPSDCTSSCGMTTPGICD